jgi:hypothetical protein
MGIGSQTNANFFLIHISQIKKEPFRFTFLWKAPNQRKRIGYTSKKKLGFIRVKSDN